MSTKGVLLECACFLVVFTLVQSTIGVIRTRSRANFGEYCDNRSIRCDSSLSLTCKNETCICLKPENMIYDSARKSCASLAGEKCKFIVMEEYRSWQEEIICVNNAHCDFVRSVCVCDKDFIELPNGTCIPKKNYMEACENTTDCKQDSSLICKDSKCVCNSSISEYSDELKQCVGLVNEPCVNDQCTANAICREEPRRVYYGGSSGEVDVSSDEYYQDSRDPASVGQCQCRTAFGVTNDGRCRMGFGGKCDYEQVKCMDWFKCKEGTCACPFPAHQVYDKGTETCLSYVGGPCTPGGSDETNGDNNESPDTILATNGTIRIEINCVANTVCQKIRGTSRYHCVCPNGFIENEERTCDLDYKERCSCQQQHSQVPGRYAQSVSYSASSNGKCDRLGKLFCIDGRCECEDNLHIYDKESRVCKGLVGATCLMKEKDGCITGAYCKGRRGGEGTEGLCTCQLFYTEIANGTCVETANNRGNHHRHHSDGKTKGNGIVLKSGGRDQYIGEGFNTTKSSIWTLFDDENEER